MSVADPKPYHSTVRYRVVQSVQPVGKVMGKTFFVSPTRLNRAGSATCGHIGRARPCMLTSRTTTPASAGGTGFVHFFGDHTSVDAQKARPETMLFT
jgi:hypothetical protein